MREYNDFSGMYYEINIKTDLQMLASLGVKEVFGKEKKCIRLIRDSIGLFERLKLFCEQTATELFSLLLVESTGKGDI